MASSFLEHSVIHQKPGWAEHDPEEHWWKDFVEITRHLLKESKINPGNITCIGVSGLCPTMCPLDKEGKPLRNAILYSDNRAIEEINVVNELLSTSLTSEEITPKILWYKKNEPTNFERTKMILNSANYVVYRLTDQYSVSHRLAASYGAIFNPFRKGWDEKVCAQLGIPVQILPPVYRTTHVIGGVTEKASKETGLSKDTPVIVGGSDVAMSMLGAGLTREGEALIYYGTAGLFHTLPVDIKDMFNGDSAPYPREYASAYLLTTGEALRWFRDQFGYCEMEIEKKTGVSAYHLLDEKASKISPGSEGLIILPYFMGQRSPEFDPLARAVFFGLTMAHTRIHIYRALLEAFGYAVYHGMVMGKKIPKRIVATGGGARSELWRQIVSDIINLPQEYVSKADASIGDAYLAGYSIGMFKDFESIKEWIRVTAITKPQPDVHEIYRRFFKIYRSLHVLKRQFRESSDVFT